MPIPDTLTKIRISGDVRHPLSGAPGTGTVEFEFGYPMRDTANNVIFGDNVVRATVTNGSFVTDEFVSPRQTGVTPQNQPLTVRILTDVYADTYPIEIPANSTGTLQLAQLAPAENPPAVVTYALASQLALYLPLAGGQLSGAARWNGTPTSSGDLTPKSYVDATIAAAIAAGVLPFLPKTGGTITGPITWNDTPSASGHLTTKAYVDAAVADGGGGGTAATLPLFNVEDYGAVGDGSTDDYAAILDAWTDMLASPVGGLVFFPRAVTYRVDASVAGRVQATGDEARALFPLPMRSRALTKLTVGVLGVGDPYAVRSAELAGTPGQVQTASVLHVDYPTPFAWSPSAGLPCVFGAPDADMTDSSGNEFSNLHFAADGMIVRQPTNPSLCGMNLENVSTVRIGSLRFDTSAVLDLIPEPTHPTGCALLLPRSNNNVVVAVDRLVTEGYYAGVPLTEHIELRTAITLRCKIGVHTRRLCSHYGKVHHLKVEQVPNGISGYDPSGTGPDGGIVPVHGWTGHIDFVDIEDYAYNGAVPWIYAPVSGVHINDTDGRFNGQIGFLGRINSEPAAPAGIGIGTPGGSSSLYVRGPAGTTASPIAIYGFHHGSAATRILPPGDVPPVEYRLFAAENGPSISATDGHNPINLGVQVNVTAAGLATKLWFYRGTTAIAGAITGRLWHKTGVGTGVALGDVTFVVSGTGWISAEFDDPIPLEVGETYVAVVHFPDEWPFTGSYWDSGAGGSGIIAGILRAFSTTDQPGGQGVFSSGAVTGYPATTGNGGNYWVDVTVTPAA